MVLKYSVPETQINLQGGWPTPRLHPAKELETAAARVFASPDIQEQLRYGPGQGTSDIRANIASWLTNEYQPAAGPISSERILVSNGASNGLATILQKFADPGYTRTIWIVEPTYHLACPIFRDAGFAGRIRAVPEGERGVNLDFLKQALEDSDKEASIFERTGPKSPENGYPKIYRHILYMVPTFSNPSGKTMALEDRKELVLLARKRDLLLITDDVYDFLRWCPEEGCTCQGTHLVPPPRLVDVDRSLPGQDEFGNAISNGSFSKIVAPGVRVGWMEGTPGFVKTLSRVAATASGGNQAHMASLVVGQMFADGVLPRHLKDVLIPTYRKRYYTIVAAIRHYLYPHGVRIITDRQNSQSTEPAGGFFLYIIFPENSSLPSIEIIHRLALEHFNLRIAPGGLFAVSNDDSPSSLPPRTFINGARLCWAWHEEKELVEGIERLAEALKMAKQIGPTISG